MRAPAGHDEALADAGVHSDEADVFLEERGDHEMQRNAMVRDENRLRAGTLTASRWPSSCDCSSILRER